jgi:hypothetical protein
MFALWIQIRAIDSAGADKLVSTLGTGDALKTKINTELKKQGLQEATGASAPAKASLSGNGMPVSPQWTLVLVLHVYAIATLF